MVKEKPDNRQNNKYSDRLPQERPQPHNLDAERAILAAMLREPEPCIDIVVENIGGSDAFYSHINREVFKTLEYLHNKTEQDVDLISVAHYLAKKDKLEDIGGEVFLAEIYNLIATTANLETWCDIVRKLSILRSMINVCSESIMKCYRDDIEVMKLVDEIETDIFKVRDQGSKSDIISIKDSLIETFKNVEALINGKKEIGIPTGMHSLDDLVGGFKPGEMFVLAARPSIGKTSLALNFIRNIAVTAKQPRCVAFFSLEMTSEQITRRLMCTDAQMSESSFYDGSFKKNEINKLTMAVSNLQKAKIFIDPTGGISIAELRAKARRLYASQQIDIIVIDYLQLMKAGVRVDNRQQEVAEISSGIKKLAKDLNIPILVLAQLNRDIEKTGSKMAQPRLSHLRESGTIEQDADVVAFLHRDRDEGKTLDKFDRSAIEADLIVEKNRNGRTGFVKLLFFPYRMEFVEKSRYDGEDRPKHE